MKKYLFLTLFAAFCSCTHYKSTDYEGSIDEGYPNGIYDAIIHVYNPNTKHNATYTLEVEVENEELIKIYWNNGGWLDDSHFSPVDISEEGSASFTDDRGYRYSVELD